MPANSLFTYGTLMIPQIISMLIRREISGEEAVLSGYRRGLIRNETYPGIIAEPGQKVAGILYRQLSPNDLAILDQYEGDMYVLKPVTVKLNHRKEHTVTYILHSSFAQLLTNNDWDPEHFRKHDLDRFLREYSGFQQ